MKKTAAMLSALALALVLCACGEESAGLPAPSETKNPSEVYNDAFMEILNEFEGMYTEYAEQQRAAEAYFEERNSDEGLRNDSLALLGTWQCTPDADWPSEVYEYTFYADGLCVGAPTSGFGGKMPSLYPPSHRAGSHDGYWEIVPGRLVPLLKVEYIGTAVRAAAGTQTYEYQFNDDYTELTIWGVNSSSAGTHERGSVTWVKVG